MPLLSDFDYYLPPEFIAQEPVSPRDKSKLMVLKNSSIEHRKFKEITEFFSDGDILVLNDTKVIPARLTGKKSTGGKIELLIMNLTSRDSDNLTLECLVRGRIKTGMKLSLNSIPATATVAEHIEEGRYFITFYPKGDVKQDFDKSFLSMMEQYGVLPLPPYIKNPVLDQNRYQTIYSEKKGSIAAPTAGLHFTEDVISELKQKGILLCYITLHISYGTFKPVREENVEAHKMDVEYYQVSEDAAALINRGRAERCLTAVGTTSVRTLESIFRNSDSAEACTGTTDLFIFPGYEFRSGITRMITNFHFPKSTLLMLVSAFAGRERILNAYEVAKENMYRFYSFGDAMLIINSE